MTTLVDRKLVRFFRPRKIGTNQTIALIPINRDRVVVLETTAGRRFANYNRDALG